MQNPLMGKPQLLPVLAGIFFISIIRLLLSQSKNIVGETEYCIKRCSELDWKIFFFNECKVDKITRFIIYWVNHHERYRKN